MITHGLGIAPPDISRTCEKTPVESSGGGGGGRGGTRTARCAQRWCSPAWRRRPCPRPPPTTRWACRAIATWICCSLDMACLSRWRGPSAEPPGTGPRPCTAGHHLCQNNPVIRTMSQNKAFAVKKQTVTWEHCRLRAAGAVPACVLGPQATSHQLHPTQGRTSSRCRRPASWTPARRHGHHCRFPIDQLTKQRAGKPQVGQ